jgi:hypothetical protein
VSFTSDKYSIYALVDRVSKNGYVFPPVATIVVLSRWSLLAVVCLYQMGVGRHPKPSWGCHTLG